MKLRLSLIFLSLLLSACAGQYTSIANKLGDCGYPAVPYTKFHECMKTKVSVSTKNETNDAYNKNNAAFLRELDDLQRYLNQKKISNKEAYGLLQQYMNREIATEQQQARQAAVAFAVLAGVAAVGICAQHHSCVGSAAAGGGAAYAIPLMCYQAPYAHPRCDRGKACGDTCISVFDTCNVGAGSACNIHPRVYP